MNKAFIFDMDGVLINNEPIWEIEKAVLFPQLFGNTIYKELGPMIGSNMEAIHQRSLQLGSSVSLSAVLNAFWDKAPEVYRNAPLTPGLQELKDELIRLDFHIGIVSASPQEWIDIVFDRLNWKSSDFKIVLSLHDRADIAHKPSPDGYIHAMKQLAATPNTTIILEDSNPGIQAAKVSGAKVIGFRENLTEGYIQTGADMYAENVEDVIKIVHDWSSK